MSSFIIPAIIVSVFYISVLNETYAGNKLCAGGVNPRPQGFLNNNQSENIRTTGTGRSRKHQEAQDCVRDMIVSCRSFGKDDFGFIYAVVPETLLCVKNAMKFWAFHLELPDHVRSYYQDFIHIIKKDSMTPPKKYCEETFTGIYSSYQLTCYIALANFGNTIESALQYALDNTRIIMYCPDISIKRLNKFDLNYYTDLSQKYNYELEIVGIEINDDAELGDAELGDAELGDAELGDAELGDAELDESELGLALQPTEEGGYLIVLITEQGDLGLSDSPAEKIAYHYLIKLIGQIEISTDSEFYKDPVSHCVKRIFDVNDYEYQNPYSIVTDNVINAVFD